VVTTGPGVTNALTGTMNAQADGSPLMLISGEIDQKFFGMGYLQEGIDASLDVNAIFNAATGYSSVIASGTDAETILRQALRDALSLPHQAVHLSVPLNVSLEPLVNPILSSSPSYYRVSAKGAPAEEVKKAMNALLSCERPLLFLGNGCRNALRDSKTYNSLLKFVETYSIPVMTTADGKGLFPESHELSLRVYGIADCMWPYQYLTAKDPAYDGIMVIGSSMGELSTNSWLPILKPAGEKTAFIQVDINQKVIARSFEVTHGVVGEAGAFIRDLAALIPEFPVEKSSVQSRKHFIRDIKKQTPFVHPASYASNKSPMHPAAMMRVLQKTMPAKSKIFIDAGNCVGWAVHYLVIDPPTSIFTSLAMGPMGFAVGAVVGAKIGCPGDTCISITGDAAFMMNGSEVSTAAANKLGAIWIVLFDNNLGMVSQGMMHFAPDEEEPSVWTKMYELGDPDLVMFAKSLGAEAYAVKSPADLEELMPKVIKRANGDNKPQVVIAHINRTPVPPYYNPVYGPKPAGK